MAELFISYAREDRGTAERLASALTMHGWSVWWDRHIPAGRRFDEVIAERLAAANCVLALWSKAAVHSEWVVEEAETARERGVFLPVMIEEVEPPLGFRRIHAADLIGWDGSAVHVGFDQLIEDISGVLRRGASMPSPADILPASQLTSAQPMVPGRPPIATVTTDFLPASAESAIRVLAREEKRSAVTWDAHDIQAIAQRLAQNVGPIARVIVARSLPDADNLAALIRLLAKSIPAADDRNQFLHDVARFDRSAAAEGEAAPRPDAGMATPSADRPCDAGGRQLRIADTSLGEIEKALARHIGPIAKVVLKRAVAQSGTADELCASLLSHIEREDDRLQFRAAVARFV